MAIFLYITVARQKPRLAQKMFWAFHVIGWGIPLVIVGIALEENVLGNDRDIYSRVQLWLVLEQGSGSWKKQSETCILDADDGESLGSVAVCTCFSILWFAQVSHPSRGK